MSKVLASAAAFMAFGFAAAAGAAPVVPPAYATAYVALKGDVARGKVVFTQCKTCHVVTPGVNRIGPSLYGVVGRPSGSIAGYAYSAANKNSHITWTEPVMFTYLEAPQKFLPGTKMSYAGLKDPQKRADVIAYLKSKPTA